MKSMKRQIILRIEMMIRIYLLRHRSTELKYEQMMLELEKNMKLKETDLITNRLDKI